MTTGSGPNSFEISEQRSFNDGRIAFSDHSAKRCEDMSIHGLICDLHHLNLGEQ